MTVSGDVHEPNPAEQPHAAEAALPDDAGANAAAEPAPLPAPEPETEPLPEAQAEPSFPAEPSSAAAAVAHDAAAPETAASGEPQLAAIVEIPAQPSADDAVNSDGGEWDLLVSQLREWLNNLKLQQSVQELRRPLTLLGWLVGLIIVLRIYAAVIGTLERLPLVPGLLELAGVVAVVRFAVGNLVRSQERQALLQRLGDRWRAFRG